MMVKMRNLAFICCLLFPSVSWGETLRSTRGESQIKKIYEIVTKGEIITEFQNNSNGISRIYLLIDYKKDLWTCGTSDRPFMNIDSDMFVKCVSMKEKD